MLKVSPNGVDIGVFCCLIVVCSMYMVGWLSLYVELPIFQSYLLHSMLGVSHAVQNEKKL